MQRVGSDPTSSGTASIVTDSRIVQRTTHLHGEQMGGVRDSSTREFQGEIITWEVCWQSQWVSPDAEKHGKADEREIGAGITDLKSDQSVDIITAHSVPAPSEARLLEVSEVPRICIARSPIGAVGNTLARDMLGPSPTPVISTLPRSKTDPWRRLRGRTSPRKTSPSEVYRVSRPLIPRSYSTPATFILVKSGLAGQTISHLTSLV